MLPLPHRRAATALGTALVIAGLPGLAAARPAPATSAAPSPAASAAVGTTSPGVLTAMRRDLGLT
ncbi:S1 family peptidase, partial [Streptomyces sp. NPDC005904]